MITIYMNNVYSEIENINSLNKNIIDLINNKLQYEIGGFGVSKETIYLLNGNKFLTGLTPYIISILKRNNVDYKLIDKRYKPEQNANFKVQDAFQARDYQQNIVDRASSREILQAATGAGKTFIMAKLIEKFKVKPVVVVAPKVSLALQIQEEFERFLNVEVGVMGGGYNQRSDIIVGTPQSLPKDVVKSAQLIMCDECLKYNQKVLMENGTYKQIGDLVKEKSTEKVMSFNHSTGKLEPKPIISHSETPLKNNNKRLMKLTIRKPDGSKEVIECTDNHKIWVESLGKYIKAGDLIKGQKVKVVK